MAVELAERVAACLGAVEGVVAVVLGGSWARGNARPNSDIDLGIYYDPAQPPSIGELRDLARRMDDRHAENLVTELGGWGPWIDGGGWLEIEGRRVDWIYRDLALVNRIARECSAGNVRSYYQPGHPHGFHTHIYLGEVHECRPLRDPGGAVAGLKALTHPYPEPLRRALVDRFSWEAVFPLDTARTSAERGDAFYVAGCLFRTAACLVQVLHPLNGRYVTNEKGAVAAADALPVRPSGFSHTISTVLAQPGRMPEELLASVERLDALTTVTDCLGGEHSAPVP